MLTAEVSRHRGQQTGDDELGGADREGGERQGIEGDGHLADSGGA